MNKVLWFWLYYCTSSNIYRLANDLALYTRLTGLLYSANLSLLTSLVINRYAHRLKMAIYKVRYFSPNSPPWIIIDHGSVFQNCLSEWMLVLIQWYLPLLSTEPFPSNRRWKARGNKAGVSPQLWGRSKTFENKCCKASVSKLLSDFRYSLHEKYSSQKFEDISIWAFANFLWSTNSSIYIYVCVCVCLSIITVSSASVSLES